MKQLVVLPVTQLLFINNSMKREREKEREREREKEDQNFSMAFHALTGFITSMNSLDCESTKLPPMRLGTL